MDHIGIILMSKFAIEICGQKNEKYLFQPAGEVLRGRWEAFKTAHRDASELMKKINSRVPTIPGVQIVVDTEAGVGIQYDPLGDPGNAEGQRIARAIADISKQYSHQTGGGWNKFDETKEFKLDASGIKDWLFNMRQAVEAGLANEVAGAERLPTLEQILALPGRVKSDPGNTGHRGETKYMHEVPDGSGGVGGGNGRRTGSKPPVNVPAGIGGGN